MNKIQALPGEIEKAKLIIDNNPAKPFKIRSNSDIFIGTGKIERSDPGYEFNPLILVAYIRGSLVKRLEEIQESKKIKLLFPPEKMENINLEESFLPIATLYEALLTQESERNSNFRTVISNKHYAAETLPSFRGLGIMKLLFEIRMKLIGLLPETYTANASGLAAHFSAGYKPAARYNRLTMKFHACNPDVVKKEINFILNLYNFKVGNSFKVPNFIDEEYEKKLMQGFRNIEDIITVDIFQLKLEKE